MQTLANRQHLNFVQTLRSMAPYGCRSNPLLETTHSRVRNCCPETPLPIKVSLARSTLSTPIVQAMSRAIYLCRIFYIAWREQLCHADAHQQYIESGLRIQLAPTLHMHTLNSWGWPTLQIVCTEMQGCLKHLLIFPVSVLNFVMHGRLLTIKCSRLSSPFSLSVLTPIQGPWFHSLGGKCGSLQRNKILCVSPGAGHGPRPVPVRCTGVGVSELCLGNQYFKVQNTFNNIKLESKIPNRDQHQEICHTSAGYRSYYRQSTGFSLNFPFISPVFDSAPYRRP
jgi:hypothetical protein